MTAALMAAAAQQAMRRRSVSGLIVSAGSAVPRSSYTEDALVWTPATTPPSVNVAGVAYSPDLNRLVCGRNTGAAGQPFISDNLGVTWAVSGGTSIDAETIAWSSILGMFAGVHQVAPAATAIKTSPTGVTWTSRAAPDGGGGTLWATVYWDPDSERFIIGANTTFGLSPALGYSDDGVTFVGATSPSPYDPVPHNGIASGGGVIVAASTGTRAYRSTDGGLTYSAAAGAFPAGSTLRRMAYGNGRFVSVTRGMASDLNCSYSDDGGLTWTNAVFAHGASSGSCPVVFSPGLNAFVCVTQTGSFYSSDGEVWIAGGSVQPAGDLAVVS